MDTTESLTPEQILALSKVASPSSKEVKGARPLVPEGQHKGECLLALKYDITVGAPHPAAPSVPWEKIAVLAMSRIDAATQKALVRQALDPEVDPKGKKATKERVQKIARELLPDVQKSGPITGTAVCTAVQLAAPGVFQLPPAPATIGAPTPAPALAESVAD